LKSKVLLSILAAVFAAFLPLAAAAQAAAPAERPEPSYKYSAYVGYGYTSLAQVNGSRYGLQGVDADVERNFGKYFALAVDGGYYKYALNTGGATNSGNPGTPSVTSVLAGPVLHAPLGGHVEVFVNVLLGAEHTAGEAMSPSTSFAGGYGGGLGYKLSKHMTLRASGERIGASFSLINNVLPSGQTQGYSSHETWNARASFGVAYRF
jgi:hypothetical protein